MYKVELYIDGQRADLFQNENIEINLSVQNIKDISKVFGDFTQSFTIPASVQNNKIFKHYYNVDISGSFNASVRVDAFIEVNHNLFRAGVLELESVQVKQGQPYAYSVGFFSNVTSLKDKFGEDQLTDLDLSAYDHTYNDTNIEAGLDGYVSGTSSSIIYPLISPVANWIYDSTSSDPLPNNIWYHNGSPLQGVFYYDLKPAIKLQKILDAIESKYSVTFNSDFFDSADFGKLFMWCHRRAGYMFKDQPNGFPPQVINFTANVTGDYNLTTQKYTVDAAQEATLRVNYSVNSTYDYKIYTFINDELHTVKSHSGNVSGIIVNYGTLNVGDTIQYKFSSTDSGANISGLSFNIEYYDGATWSDADTASRSTAQSIVSTIEVSEQMPEQKVSDFIGSLVRAFNLVIVPTGNGQYDIEPLDDWYAEGTTREITEYVDTEEVNINKPQLYRRISYKYNETEAILGEQYRLQNDIGYGDLRADFTFDGEEFNVEVGFDNMLFERLDDLNNGVTEINVGKSITRELEPYIGQPFIFYAAGVITITDNNTYGYVSMTDTEVEKEEFWLVSNVNAITAADVTKTLNFGTEVDPYLLQGFSQGLYNTYWKDYITDLYDTSRRVFSYKAQLPLGIMLALKVNDKLTINERNYIINQLKLNLTTGEAQMELLNDV